MRRRVMGWYALLLVGCGGKGADEAPVDGSSPSATTTSSEGVGTDSGTQGVGTDSGTPGVGTDTGSTRSTTDTGVTDTAVPPGSMPSEPTATPADTVDLGFGTLSTTHLALPNDWVNAAEVYQLAHYIARTDPEIDEADIDVPIRSYFASCDTDTDTPKLFVSVTLSDGTTPDDDTFGYLVELAFDPTTSTFAATGNSTVLDQCLESHGVAVSDDCSRVAVLCNTPYAASESATIAGDLVEDYGTEWMRWADNHAEIDARIEDEFGLMLATNHGALMGWFVDHPTLTIDDFLDGLMKAFPGHGFSSKTTWDDLKGSDMAEPVDWIVEQLDPAEYDSLVAHVQSAAYKENEQIWLLEWDAVPITDPPDTYVVNKLHGGTHTGAEELLYVGDDAKGRASYAFSVTGRIFDDDGDSHYSAGLTVIDRNTWALNMGEPSPAPERGWYWACGDGHLLNIRAFYNPWEEQYGAICTSDWNDWVGGLHGALGTIGVKMEDSSSWYEGRSIHMIPSNNTLTSNGGGHTVVPGAQDEMLAVVVAPQLIADDDMDRFLVDEIGVDLSVPGPYDLDCYNYYETINCFFAYLTMEEYYGGGTYQAVPMQNLYSAGELESSSLTRIGIGPVDESGSISRSGFRWVGEDDDCQLSDPQLVDLENGRYLLGYARFQCISDGEGFDRTRTQANDRLRVARGYVFAEIDAEGNVLEGPVEITGHGWGGIDEPVRLGRGRVAWAYIQNPTHDAYGGGQQNDWEALVYTSAVP